MCIYIYIYIYPLCYFRHLWPDCYIDDIVFGWRDVSSSVELCVCSADSGEGMNCVGSADSGEGMNCVGSADSGEGMNCVWAVLIVVKE